MQEREWVREWMESETDLPPSKKTEPLLFRRGVSGRGVMSGQRMNDRLVYGR